MKLTFDNSFVRELPGDPITVNRRRQVEGACYSKVSPTPVADPQRIAHAREVASLLGLSESDCQSSQFTSVFGGNALMDGMEPHATCYGGHQFGHWAGQLGDGRAISLGECITANRDRWELQLKGAGPTPYSRSADGRAVLRSSIREFLCSEAMHHLGVPTTRALSLVTTGDQVLRDMFYDGNPAYEPGAIVCRVAPSFIRFGHFEILRARGDEALLKSLADHTIRRHAPHLGEPGPDTYGAWFREICEQTALMIAHWMRVGFVHGVMNTDNMSILSLTIDYGPYGWLENFDPDWTPNTTDRTHRRYRYGAQPQIASWNLARLANALFPLVGHPEPFEDAMRAYASTYQMHHRSMFGQKLGIENYRAGTSSTAGELLEDDALIGDLLSAMQTAEVDMTIFFRRLSQFDSTQHPTVLESPMRSAYYQAEKVSASHINAMDQWLGRYASRIQEEPTSVHQRRQMMDAVNPMFVLRNYIAQLVIEQSSQGQHELLDEVLNVLRRPYDDQPEYQHHAAKRPEWARHKPGCSMLSCSS